MEEEDQENVIMNFVSGELRQGLLASWAGPVASIRVEKVLRYKISVANCERTVLKT